MIVMLQNIITGPVAYEATIRIISVYKFESDDNKPEIFDAFSLDVCFLMFWCSMILYALITIE